MKYVHAIEWNQNGIPHDITELVTDDGNLNQGVGTPDQLYAFTSGDLELTALDVINEGESTEPFISTPFFSAILNLANLPSYKQEAIVTLKRDGEVIFRGLVDPITVKVDKKTRTARFVIFGGMRLCDRALAYALKRSFPSNVTTTANLVKGTRQIPVSTAPLDIAVNDIVTIAGDDYPASGSGYPPGGGAYSIFLTAGLKDDLDANAPVTFPTPWLRDQYIGDNVRPGLVHNLLSLAGITDVDVRWSGLISNEKFLANIKSTGLFGMIGAREGLGSGTRYLQVIGNAEIWRLANQYDGPSLTGLSVGGSDGYEYLGGPQNDPGQHGFKYEAAPGDLAYAYRLRDDAICFEPPLEHGLHRLVRRTYALLPTTTPGQATMYEMEFRQDVRDVNWTEISPGVPGDFEVSGLPDYAGGGRGYSLYLRAWRTSDYGVSWFQDSAWLTTYGSTNVQVMGTPGATQWAYHVEFVNANGHMIARTPTKTISNGNAVLDNVNYNRVYWNATPSGTTSVRVFRETAGGSPGATGLIAVYGAAGAGSINDDGLLPTSTIGICPLNELRIAEDPDYHGESGILFDWSLAAVPYMNVGSSVSKILYFNVWNGASTPSVMFRVKMGTYIVSDVILHYGVGGFRVTMTNSWSSYGGAGTEPRHVHIYWHDLASVPGLVHDEDDGQNVSTPTGHVFYLGSLKPVFRTLTWNGKDGVDSRIGLFFSDAANGTSFMEFFSGGTWAVEGYSFFSRVQTVTIDPDVATYTSAFVPLNQTPPTRIAGAIFDDQPSWVYGGNPPPKYGGGRLIVSRWQVVIGGQTINVWFVSNGLKTGIVSKYHNGFITVADFSELNVSAAIQQLAFIVGASFDVDFNDSLQPRAQFVGRDINANVTPKLLANLDWSAPSGALYDLVVDVDYDRAWMHTYPFVSVKGRSLRVDNPLDPWWKDADANVNVDLEGVAGDETRRDDGLEITTRFADTLGLCQVIARTAYRLHAPAMNEFAAPSVASSYAEGGSWSYAIVAIDASGRRIAASAIGTLANGPSFVSSVKRIYLTWDAVENAVDYKVVRVSTPSTSGTSIGVIAVSIGNNQTYQDSGISADGSQFQGVLLSPRQAAKLVVFDDGTRWRQRGVVKFPDPYGTLDIDIPSEPPQWWIENIDRQVSSSKTTLSVVLRDAR